MAKVLVSFDDRLLRRIDRAAQARSKSRSAYLSDLAEGDLKSRTGPGATPSTRSALKKLDKLFAEAPHPDSTEAIRAARDAR